jgi:hypothetical protein
MTICRSAFEKCENLRKVSIPNCIRFIGESAFAVCKSLEEIEFRSYNTCKIGSIPVNVLIGDYAFALTSIKKIQLDLGVNNLKCISKGMFTGCKSLEEIYIPATVRSIKKYAFDNCNSLRLVLMPKYMPKISEHVFDGCDSLEQIDLYDI